MCYVPPTARHFIIVHHTSQKNKRGEKKFVVVSHNGPLLFIEKCDFVSRQKHIHSLVFGWWMYILYSLFIYLPDYIPDSEESKSSAMHQTQPGHCSHDKPRLQRAVPECVCLNNG